VPDKTAPLGICDHCGDSIPRARWYTSKHKPRLYCGRECRNTANSRAGADERSRKAKLRVEAGEWQNPHLLNPPTPEEQARRARLSRLREVEAGEWRNPALTDEARAKNAQPRKHTGPLADAIHKLSQGVSLAELSPAEREAHRQYRAEMTAPRRGEINAQAREQYRQRQAAMTDDEREAQRQKWREANRRRAK